MGRFWDAHVLGYYTRASDWLPGPINRLLIPIAGVAVSTLSRLTDQPERFRAYFRQGIQIVALLGTPVVCFFLLDARQIVLFLLGDQWFPTTPVLRCLAPAAFATLAQMGLHWAFVSLGNAGRQFQWECFSLAVIVAGIFLGIRWGVNGAALGYSIASILLIPPGAWYCFRKTPLQTRDLTGAFFLPLTGSLIGMACLTGLHLLFTLTAGNTIRLMFDAAFFSIFYLISLPIIPGGRKAVTGWVGLLRDLRQS